MGEGPGDGFAAAGWIVGGGVVESEFEAALGRIGNRLHAVFEVEPADGLALVIALEAFEMLGGEQEMRILRVGGGKDG